MKEIFLVPNPLNILMKKKLSCKLFLFFSFFLFFEIDFKIFKTRYAYFKKLDYFSTECIYSPNAYRGYARAFLKDLEAIRPSSIIGNIH